MKKVFSHSFHRAETLIEVLMSLSVLMIMLMPALALNIQSIRSTAMGKHNLIATGLVEEGVGMMGGIRTANLRKFSPKAQQCWNTKPSHMDLANCELTANQIAAGSYTIGKDTLSPRLPISLELQAAPLDAQNLTAADAAYELKLDEDLTKPGCDDPGLPQGTPCHTHFVDDTHLYNHKQGQASGFYREIKIEYPFPGKAFMEVTSTVVYRSGAKITIMKRRLGLTNNTDDL